MNIRAYLIVLAAFISLTISSTWLHAEEESRRPNIILLYTDDQAGGMTGFEGNRQVKTPNLDRLADQGCYFNRCYVPTPQCAPSRAVVLTGQYPHVNGVTTNVISHRGDEAVPMRLQPDAVTVSGQLQKAGYRCGVVGKWHLKYEDSRDPGFGFADYVATDGSPWRWHGCDVFVQGKKTKADKFLTDWHGDRAVEFVEKFKDDPFFLWVCFRSPHAPLTYPPGTESMYPPEKIVLPRETMGIDPQEHFPMPVRSAPPVNAYKRTSPEHLQHSLSKYYAMISRIDENVGRILNRLDTLGLAEDTVVIFTSDNGWCLGHHQLYHKGPFFYDELIRMPMVMRWPGHIKRGSRIERVTSFVDLAPTILDLAGVEKPETMQGQSMQRLLDDPQSKQWQDVCFLEYDEQKNHKYPARGVVTTRYKFIDYEGPNDVLFDLQEDPKELKNVFGDEAYADTVKQLRQLISQHKADSAQQKERRSASDTRRNHG